MALVILKYFGLCLATVSSVWGTVHNLTVQLPDGKKRITRPGKVAIFLTVMGLVVSILSDDLQRRQAAKEHFEKLRTEAKRTNKIIVSAQPLTSLDVAIRFNSGDEQLQKEIDSGLQEIQENSMSSQGGVPRIPFDTMEYQAAVIPVLKYLGRLGAGSTTNRGADSGSDAPAKDRNSTFAIIPLDDSGNTVLSFGQIDDGIEWQKPDGHAELSAGFAPTSARTRKGKTSPSLSYAGNGGYELTWHLDPVTLYNSISRGVEAIHATAKLPRSMKVAVLYNGSVLPFEKNNFALSTATNLWNDEDEERSKGSQKAQPPIELIFKVNGFGEIVYKYKLESVYAQTLFDDFDDEIQLGCTILKFNLSEEL